MHVYIYVYIYIYWIYIYIYLYLYIYVNNVALRALLAWRYTERKQMNKLNTQWPLRACFFSAVADACPAKSAYADCVWHGDDKAHRAKMTPCNQAHVATTWHGHASGSGEDGTSDLSHQASACIHREKSKKENACMNTFAMPWRLRLATKDVWATGHGRPAPLPRFPCTLWKRLLLLRSTRARILSKWLRALMKTLRQYRSSYSRRFCLRDKGFFDLEQEQACTGEKLGECQISHRSSHDVSSKHMRFTTCWICPDSLLTPKRSTNIERHEVISKPFPNDDPKPGHKTSTYFADLGSATASQTCTSEACMTGNRHTANLPSQTSPSTMMWHWRSWRGCGARRPEQQNCKMGLTSRLYVFFVCI